MSEGKHLVLVVVSVLLLGLSQVEETHGQSMEPGLIVIQMHVDTYTWYTQTLSHTQTTHSHTHTQNYANQLNMPLLITQSYSLTVDAYNTTATHKHQMVSIPASTSDARPLAYSLIQL